MAKPKLSSVFSAAGIALACIPMLILVLFYAYVVRARMTFGYWPSHSHPESWSIGFSHHYALLRPWFHTFPLWLLPFYVAVFNFAVWAVFRKCPKWSLAALAFSAFTVFAILYFDPGKFIDWFLD